MEKSIRMSAQELKQHFLESAMPLVDEYIGAALGELELSSTNSGCREEVWDLLKKLMLQSSDKLEIDIKSAEDVIEAVSKGRCTMDEGKHLLDLYKKVKEINSVGALPGGESGGLTINILAAPNVPEQIPVLVPEEA